MKGLLRMISSACSCLAGHSGTRFCRYATSSSIVTRATIFTRSLHDAALRVVDLASNECMHATRALKCR